MKDYSKDLDVRLVLVDLNDCDVDTKWKLRDWRNREDIRKWMDTRHIISNEEHNKWLEKIQFNPTQKQFVVFANDEPVGLVGFQEINHDHKTCYEHIYMAKAKGIAVRVEKMALNWLFTETDIEKCALYFYEGNPVYYVHLKTGFKMEGRIVSFAVMDGKRVDVIFMGQSREEWIEHNRQEDLR